LPPAEGPSPFLSSQPLMALAIRPAGLLAAAWLAICLAACAAAGPQEVHGQGNHGHTHAHKDHDHHDHHANHQEHSSEHHDHDHDHDHHDEHGEHHDEHHDHGHAAAHSGHGHKGGQDHDHDHDRSHDRLEQGHRGPAHGHGVRDDHDHGQHHKGHSHGGPHRESHKKEPPRWAWAYASALGMSAVSFVGVALLGLLRTPSMGAVVEYTCLAFAGSVLVADALLHLLPHALEGADHGQASAVGLSAVAGSLGLLIVPELCELHKHSHGHSIEASGIANLVVEMLHNFVDGLAIGLSFLAGKAAGTEATLAVACHELPQELGDFMVLRAAGFAVPRLLFYNFAASLTCVLGVAAAHLIGQEATEAVQRHLMAFTGGSFLTLSLSMIYPQVLASIHAHHKGRAAAYAKLACIGIAGLAIVVLLKVGSMEAGHAHEHHDHHGHHNHHGEF